MGRSPCCAKEGLNRGAWTAIEDKILVEYIKTHGEGKWRHLPKRAGLKRCGKSCRLRWLNYLRPDIKRGNITRDEEDLIIRLHKLLGNRWALIAGRLPGRTDNEIKNYWNTNMGKKLQNRNSKSFTTSSGGGGSSSMAGQDSGQNPKTRLTNTGSGVVRTKATRCTRVIVSKEAQQYGALMIVPPNCLMTPDNVSDKKMDGAGEFESSSPPSQESTPFDLEGNNPLDFMADFEMDENFFSDLLNMDISQPSCFENEVQVAEEDVDNNDATTSENGCHQLSPNSSDAHFNISDDSLHASEDLQSMSTLMDNEFDWL